MFYLSFADDRALRALHERLASSGIRFAAVPFAFEPHVTLSTRAPVDDRSAREMLATRVPGMFTLDTLSVYELPMREPPHDRFATLLCLLYRTTLRGIDADA